MFSSFPNAHYSILLPLTFKKKLLTLRKFDVQFSVKSAGVELALSRAHPRFLLKHTFFKCTSRVFSRKLDEIVAS